MKNTMATTMQNGVSPLVKSTCREEDLRHATIDFETRSRVEIGDVGAYQYAMHESTRVLCLVYSLPGYMPMLWHPKKEPPHELLEWVKAGNLIEAHNAEFEYCMWKYHCVPKLAWPELPITQMRCSAAKAAALSLPRKLEQLALALKLPVQKDMEGNRLMLKMTKPRKPTKNNPSEWWDEPSDYLKLYRYCRTDVLTEEEASKRLAPLNAYEEKIFQFTVAMNERGIYCDIDACKKAVDFAMRYEGECLGEFQELTNGQVQTVKQLKKFHAVLMLEGLDMPDFSALTVSDTLARNDLTPRARRLLELRQAISQSSISKFSSMLAMAGPDNRIRGTLMYHGASTGRYSGRGIQPQNYAKPKIKDVNLAIELLKDGDYEFFRCVFPNVFVALSACLRGMLQAAPGYILRSADFSAIEARVILWLADDKKNLEAHYRGEDTYKTMGALVYGIKLTEVKDYPHRDLGKRIILGCGFGMGWKKFKQTCWDQGRLVISDELAKKAVETYREEYAAVKEFWYKLDATVKEAIKNPEKTLQLGKLFIRSNKEYLQIKLPSGRKLSYYKPEIVVTIKEWGAAEEIRYWAVNSLTKKWEREATYGGKLAENVTQAVARDVMIEAMVRVENAGYPCIMSVHDEIVSEAPENHGSQEEFLKLIEEVPHWAKGIPLKVSGWSGPRYRK